MDLKAQQVSAFLACGTRLGLTQYLMLPSHHPRIAPISHTRNRYSLSCIAMTLDTVSIVCTCRLSMLDRIFGYLGKSLEMVSFGDYVNLEI